MAFTIRGELTGLKDVMRRLRTLGNRTTQGKVLRAALQVATKPMLDAARALVPKETGLLKRSLTRKTKTYRSSGVVVVIIGPKTGLKRQVAPGRGGRLRVVAKKKESPSGRWRAPTKYAHLVELGTKRSRAQPFLAPAFERCKTQAIAVLRREILGGIGRLAA